MLRFNSTSCINALRAELIVSLKNIQDEYLIEVQSHMQTANGKDDVFSGDIETLATYLSCEIIGGPYAVMDNFGTGSLMDKDNPVLEWYKRSEFWNPARTDEFIRGRPEGDYTNIFGEEAYSTGSMKGLIIEQPLGPAEPIAPSHAFQYALNWMVATGRLKNIVSNIILNFNFDKFIIDT